MNIFSVWFSIVLFHTARAGGIGIFEEEVLNFIPSSKNSKVNGVTEGKNNIDTNMTIKGLNL
eukprot:Awhi_evm1s6484